MHLLTPNTPGGRPLRPSHRSAAHSAWSAWQAPSMPSAALPHWRLSPGSWSPQSSTTSGGKAGPRVVRGIMRKADGLQHCGQAPRHLAGSSEGRAGPCPGESCGEGTADKPCSALFLASLVGKVWVCTPGTTPHCGTLTVSQSGTDPKFRPMETGPRSRGALKRQPGLSFPLPPGCLLWEGESWSQD